MLIPMLLLSAIALPDAPPVVEDIRAEYGEAMQAASDSTLYRTSVVVNADGRQYPAVGIYLTEVDLYWDAEGGESELELGIFSAEIAAHREYVEVLYRGSGDETYPAFMLYAFRNGTGPVWEYRTWYDESGEVLHLDDRMIEDGVTEHLTPDPEWRGEEGLAGWMLELYRTI